MFNNVEAFARTHTRTPQIRDGKQDFVREMCMDMSDERSGEGKKREKRECSLY